MIDVKTQVSPNRKKSRRKVAMEIGAIIVVLIVLIIFASVLLGPVVGPLIGSAGNGPASGGFADSSLKQDVWSTIQSYERTNGCAETNSNMITVIQQPDASGAWVESWSVGACGQVHLYKVHYSTNAAGETVYSVTR